MSHKQIFVVSDGEYSDYTVLAAFDSEETAERWAQALRNDSDGWHNSARVESLTLIDSAEPIEKRTTYRQNVELWDDGTTDTKGVFANSHFPVGYFGPPPVRPIVRYVRAPCHKNKGGRLEVTANSEAAVRKVVGERMAMWKAGAFGGPGVNEINEELAE